MYGEGADVVIVAGCGIHNCGNQKSQHDGIHTFYIGKNAKVKYVEKHYGEGDGTGENVLNPVTVCHLDEGSYMEMETVQIKGVDSTNRKTKADLKANATLIIGEKIFTHGNQNATTEFEVTLDGENHPHPCGFQKCGKGQFKAVVPFKCVRQQPLQRPHRVRCHCNGQSHGKRNT